jgi:hypothetical protein
VLEMQCSPVQTVAGVPAHLLLEAVQAGITHIAELTRDDGRRGVVICTTVFKGMMSIGIDMLESGLI